MSRYRYGEWAPYVPVAERRNKAARKVASLLKKGTPVEPVVLGGRAIATTFWGKAWCKNLEAYSDYENRLPRGRSYLRNGSVIHLAIQSGKVEALVQGSSMYRVAIAVGSCEPAAWKTIARECAGQVASVVELLQGKLSRGVMEILTRPSKGLFPMPREIGLSCSCPDGARMCKHVAAVLYGVGSRLDLQPDLLFVLRQVDQGDLVCEASAGAALGRLPSGARSRILEKDDLGDLFGIELEESGQSLAAAKPSAPLARTARAATSKVAAARGPVATPKIAKRGKAAGTSNGSRTSPGRAKRSGLERGGKTAAAAVPGRKTAPRKASKSKPVKERIFVRLPPRLSGQELVEMGIPRSTYQEWIAQGALLPTSRRGVYRTTGEAAAQVQRYYDEHDLF